MRMGVYINGMEMPKPKLADMATIYGAYILVSPNGHAAIVVENEDGLDTTEYHLTYVPPHGKLKDADAIERNLLKMQQAQTGPCSHGIRKSRAVLRDAPTIIPAVEGE
jgi:hypothetical protein